MKREEYWQNFELGKELEVAGAFIYDGLQQFHGMASFQFDSEVFTFLYKIAVGFERLFKVAIILLDHTSEIDQSAFESKLISHDHMGLMNRILESGGNIKLGSQHNEFLSILSKFYKTYRYGRFSLNTSLKDENEKSQLKDWITKNLKHEFPSDEFAHNPNTAQIKQFVSNITKKITLQVYEIIRDAARSKNLYTDEVRYPSKLFKLMIAKEFDFLNEEILWRELLIFIVNNKEHSETIEFMKGIVPLPFDVGLMQAYLGAFSCSDERMTLVDELESHYQDVEKPGERIELVKLLGNPEVDFEYLPSMMEDQVDDTSL